ncbi:MAG: type II glyceraldehyde-3-phosphate dehydrogenase [Thermoplasmata archaeon]
MVVRVGVNGYGTIGKRVADAVARQSDLTLVGVTKTRPNFEAVRAAEHRHPLFIAGGGRRAAFDAAGVKVAGTLDDLLQNVDVIVDCTPDKVGRNNQTLYNGAKVRAVFQGGEKPDVADVSFNALANFEAARGKRRVRVVSCNTTGLSRAAAVLRSEFGVRRWEATIVRRAADPPEVNRGPINGILPTFHLPSHHGADVQTIFPDLDITTTAVVVPTTLMHVHVNHVELTRPPSDAGQILSAFRRIPRFRIFQSWEGVEGTPQVMEVARDHGTPDMMPNVLWEEGLRLDGPDLYFFQAIHQESVVVPENIDAIRAMFDLSPDAQTSISTTDRSLGLTT